MKRREGNSSALSPSAARAPEWKTSLVSAGSSRWKDGVFYFFIPQKRIFLGRLRLPRVQRGRPRGLPGPRPHPDGARLRRRLPGEDRAGGGIASYDISHKKVSTGGIFFFKTISTGTTPWTRRPTPMLQSFWLVNLRKIFCVRETENNRSLISFRPISTTRRRSRTPSTLRTWLA